MTEKRFVKGYCCGDTGLVDKEKEEWFVENINSISDSERNWNDVLDKLNEVAEENEQLQHKLSQQEMEYATDLYRLAEENRRLQQEIDSYKIFQTEARKLVKENEELKQKVSFYKDFQKETILKSDLNKWIEKKMDYYERIMEKTEGSNYTSARGHLDMLIVLKEWIKQR